MKKYQRLVCFDLEHCCWQDRPIGEIIEFGLAELDLPTGEIVRQRGYYVCPQHDEVSAYCTELTGITPRMVAKQGRPLPAVIKTVIEQFGGPGKVFACWGNDQAALASACAAHGIDTPIVHCLDLSLLYGLRHRVTRSPGWQAAMATYGLAPEGRLHSGVDDAVNLARLAVHLISAPPVTQASAAPGLS